MPSLRWALSRPLSISFLLLCILSPAGLSFASTNSGGDPTRVLSYRMKGKVRLLFFWVGKDDVGGGTITLQSNRGEDGALQEKVEILFGSNPERVPGGINRWGYGREAATWKQDPLGRTLQETFFEGFMKYSREESLDEVQSNNERQLSGAEFVYEGIRSTVRPAETLSEIRVFSVEEDFDYRNATSIHCGYARRLEQGPPDRKKRLANESHYEAPMGFLTALRAYLTEVVDQHRSGGEPQPLPARRFAYNSKIYQLEMRNLKYLDSFDLPMPSGAPDRKFEKVAKADIRNSPLGESWHHDFSIWFGLEGPYRAVPLRIVDKPRWWLRVELNLDPDHSTQLTRAAITKPAEIGCIQQTVVEDKD